MPLVHDSWEDMVRSLEEASPNLDSIASFTFHNAYFMDRMMDEDDYARGNYDQVKEGKTTRQNFQVCHNYYKLNVGFFTLYS